MTTSNVEVWSKVKYEASNVDVLCNIIDLQMVTKFKQKNQ